ncbi:hypothetical protein T4C_4520 [Trichinella pseudospiralis]|uniref:Uncharacterized protein n=1 Tax=Trichinella pseudospiralis TaxID=6337 RepID=A0A0V0XVE8_TRIPS|nr:hypothetical protein T4E_4160 [Trichinella pseudospiralis]KRZ35844.1 hypothetical protein T4C_4520 [Trichinella pseudospiralis]
MNRTQMLKTLKFEVFWTENQEQLNQSKDVLAEAECGAKVVVCGRVFGATKQTPILHRYMMLALTSARNHWVSGAEPPMFRFSTCRARTVDLLF